MPHLRCSRPSIGPTITAALNFVLGHSPERFGPDAIQTLHALFYDVATPMNIGASVFLGGAAAAIVRTRALPVWSAWFAGAVVLIGLGPSPFADYGALLGLSAWIVASTIALEIRIAKREL